MEDLTSPTAYSIMEQLHQVDVTVIGAGFTGLTAAYELAKDGLQVNILEAESVIGGLAAAFHAGGERIDRFYHHWFTNDTDAIDLISELGLEPYLEIHPSNTGMYYANQFFKLSTPWDLLKFSPLALSDRIRLGLLTLRARQVKDWRLLEKKSARVWLQELGGENVFRVVWQPLLQGKFGPYADEISAVWMWNKLKLRGGSRGKKGEEQLAYFQGGFVALAEAIAEKICLSGSQIHLSTPAHNIEKDEHGWKINTVQGQYTSQQVVVTTALPQFADMIESWASTSYLAQLRRIHYLGNICLVLELDRSLSSTYWLNVNDPDFPFVGVIEHTNFIKPSTYNGRHIVYLSKYLPHTDPLYTMDADTLLAYTLPFLKKMFPAFEKSWVLKHHLWRARWSQPIVEQSYSALIPSYQGPKDGLYVCSMAQIYPEDRGTNYAIREGRKIGRQIVQSRKV